MDESSLHEGFDDSCDKCGVDGQKDCLVICRPGQHVSCVLHLEGSLAINDFFEMGLISVA